MCQIIILHILNFLLFFFFRKILSSMTMILQKEFNIICMLVFEVLLCLLIVFIHDLHIIYIYTYITITIRGTIKTPDSTWHCVSCLSRTFIRRYNILTNFLTYKIWLLSLIHKCILNITMQLTINQFQNKLVKWIYSHVGILRRDQHAY